MYIYIAAVVAMEVPIVEVTSRIKLKVWVKIWQPEELKAFNSLKLSIVLLLVICC